MPSLPDIARSRQRASLPATWMDGWRRALGAPLIPIGITALTFLLALPLTPPARLHIGPDLGARLTADAIAGGSDTPGIAALAREPTRLEHALTHTLMGSGAARAGTAGGTDRTGLPGPLAAFVALQFVLWLFLWGGIIDRYAGVRRGGPTGFFRASGAYAFRFLRLAVPVALAGWLVAAWLHPWAALPLMVFLALTTDVARVRTVVEDRRSMLGAVVAALRFMRRRPVGVLALFVLNLAVLVVLLAACDAIAPGPAASPMPTVALVQGCLLARLWTRLALTSSLLALVQAEFRPAAARAVDPIWPDAPASTDDLL